MGANLPLTRRRDPDYEAWLIFYGDLHVARSACDLALRLLVQFQPNLIAVAAIIKHHVTELNGNCTKQ